MSTRSPIGTLLIRFGICLAWVAALVLGGRAAGVNATTAALAFLLVVLGVATRWGLMEASFTSVAGMLAFNYFFLPPIGTLTISDPQNWIALFAFFVTAITASQLSARARREMEETRSSRNELSRLYELSRSLLMNESGEPVHQSVVSVSQTLGGKDAVFFDARSGRTWAVTGGSPAPPEAELLKVAQTGEHATSGEYTVVPVRIGTRLVGSLAVQAEGLSPAACDSVANLVAINYERELALERAATAEIARRNEEFKSSLLNGLAHDLKTPLTAIRTCVTRLIDFPPRTEELRHELLSIIDQESMRLQRSITETIELARIESSDISLDRRRIAVSEIIAAAIAQSGDEDPGRFIVSGPEAIIDGDPDLLRRALIQILENGRKYSPPDSPIEIAIEADSGSAPETITISVSDRGPGFAPGESSRVFDKFYRGTAGRAREGTGMGLAIAKGIVEAHGGSVTAGNRATGGGVLSFSVPRARDIHEHAHDTGSG